VPLLAGLQKQVDQSDTNGSAGFARIAAALPALMLVLVRDCEGLPRSAKRSS
jgi:hypothetical protein